MKYTNKQEKSICERCAAIEEDIKLLNDANAPANMTVNNDVSVANWKPKSELSKPVLKKIEIRVLFILIVSKYL